MKNKIYAFLALLSLVLFTSCQYDFSDEEHYYVIHHYSGGIIVGTFVTNNVSQFNSRLAFVDETGKEIRISNNYIITKYKGQPPIYKVDSEH